MEVLDAGYDILPLLGLVITSQVNLGLTHKINSLIQGQRIPMFGEKLRGIPVL